MLSDQDREALTAWTRTEGLVTWLEAEAVFDAVERIVAREKATTQALHRDLVSRLGFGDGITEPMADNDTIVKWFHERGRDADEWTESQQWRVECALVGHSEDQDCFEHDPMFAEARGKATALREAAEDPNARLSGHSGVSVKWLRERADRIEATR